MKKYIVLVVFLIVGCTNTHRANLYHPYSGGNKKDVFVVQYSWHSAVIVKKNDIPDDLIPEKNDFLNAEFLEIGWGNKAFY